MAEFQWDPTKAKANIARHDGVSFEEATTVFDDPLAKIFKDDDHSFDEQREVIIGHSIRERLVLVAFTAVGENVRIISAREATTTERKEYEENSEW